VQHARDTIVEAPRPRTNAHSRVLYSTYCESPRTYAPGHVSALPAAHLLYLEQEHTIERKRQVDGMGRRIRSLEVRVYIHQHSQRAWAWRLAHLMSALRRTHPVVRLLLYYPA